IAIDQGTTSSRAVLFDAEAQMIAIEQQEFSQYFPKSGWVEHDPEEIWSSQEKVLVDLIENNKIDSKEIAAIGITNQRETTIVWDRSNGKPIHKAIVWQDKRTSKFCDELKEQGHEDYVRKNTGLVIDSYFSGTKVKWILDNVDGARQKADKGELLFGTVDSWLVYKLTEGSKHCTDHTNASRTMLFNIKEMKWDDKMLDLLDIPKSMVPEAMASNAHFGDWNYKGQTIPIHGIAGDQQAALFGQTCIEPGMAKNTYGTGCFMLMNTGDELHESKNGLLSTIAYSLDEETKYALEGSIFIAGAVVQWLRDGLEIIDHAEDTEDMAEEVSEVDDLIMVPAFVGMGAPYWDQYARGAIFGINRDTNRAHFAKAALESMAYQTKDILDAMQKDSGITLEELKVDGGAVSNNYLMQFQSDLLNVPVIRPKYKESTALGAALMAGYGVGIFDKERLKSLQEVDKEYTPKWSQERRKKAYALWQKAIKRTLNWLDEE
ncbi:glycerol kinase GlpK, partial [Fulvivirga aurantia]|uniref:glycerol kinase GlpK n=1 Tax=Fulvivirga aurantia TaxID=2529383 RepID=UPI0012BD170A